MSAKSGITFVMIGCGGLLVVALIGFVIAAAVFGWSEPAPPKKQADQARPVLIEAEKRLREFYTEHKKLPRNNEELGTDLWTWSGIHRVDDYVMEVFVSLDGGQLVGSITAYDPGTSGVDIRLDVATGKFSYRYHDRSPEWVTE
jgi:hypothetical protein